MAADGANRMLIAITPALCGIAETLAPTVLKAKWDFYKENVFHKEDEVYQMAIAAFSFALQHNFRRNNGSNVFKAYLNERGHVWHDDTVALDAVFAQYWDLAHHKQLWRNGDTNIPVSYPEAVTQFRTLYSEHVAFVERNLGEWLGRIP